MKIYKKGKIDYVKFNYNNKDYDIPSKEAMDFLFALGAFSILLLLLTLFVAASDE